VSEAGNDEIQNVQRESKHGFLFCGNYILKYWYVIKACYNNGQKERLCLIIDLRLECLHQRVVRNTIFRKAPPSVVSGYGKRSINLNNVVATFEKHIFLSQTDLTRTGIISNSYNEIFLNRNLGKQSYYFHFGSQKDRANYFRAPTSQM
jgi:hypothetical protein